MGLAGHDIDVGQARACCLCLQRALAVLCTCVPKVSHTGGFAAEAALATRPVDNNSSGRAELVDLGETFNNIRPLPTFGPTYYAKKSSQVPGTQTRPTIEITM